MTVNKWWHNQWSNKRPYKRRAKRERDWDERHKMNFKEEAEEKNQQTSSSLSVICGLSFHYVIWIALPHVSHILCMQLTHRTSLLSRYTAWAYLLFPLFLGCACVIGITALSHAMLLFALSTAQETRDILTYKKHLVRQRISLQKKCLHWVSSVFISNKFNERIVCCEKSSLCFIDIFDWIVAFACALKWLLEIIIWFNVHICLEITLILNLIPHKSV